MKNTLLYLLKSWITCSILTPITFVLLLAVLPSYQIPELIGFELITFILPCAFILSLWVTLNLFWLMAVLKSFVANSVRLKLSLSAIAILLCFLGLKFIYAFHILNAVEEDYLLAVAISISIIACIWFY